MNRLSRHLFLQAAVLAFFFCFTQQTAISQAKWSEEEVRVHAQSYNNPNLWDREMFAQEQEVAPILVTLDLPLRLTPFPVPEYDSPGNGNRGLDIEVNGQKLTGHAVMVARNDYNGHLFTSDDEEMSTYFTLIVPDDGDDADDPVVASSRNHPNYVAQGSLNHMSDTRVDWVAVQAANGFTHAIVNGRFFDLSAGYVVLAKPMDDGTIRFHQLDMQPIMHTEWDLFESSLDENEEVKTFYSRTKR